MTGHRVATPGLALFGRGEARLREREVCPSHLFPLRRGLEKTLPPLRGAPHPKKRLRYAPPRVRNACSFILVLGEARGDFVRECSEHARERVESDLAEAADARLLHRGSQIRQERELALAAV